MKADVFTQHLTPLTHLSFIPSFDWQVSAGDFGEALRPVWFVLAVLASAWVLSDARRRRGFGQRAVAAWTLLTLLFPPFVLPLYLAARLFTRRRTVSAMTEGGTGTAACQPAQQAPSSSPSVSAEVETRRPGAEGPETDEAHVDEGLRVDEETGGLNVGGEGTGRNACPTTRFVLALPLVYAAVLLAVGAAYFYLDYRSFDAHLARAARAKLYGRRARAVAELRAALGRREDAHTRKLLGLELIEGGRAEEGLAELRAARRGGEPDERIQFHEAQALEALGRRDEAAEAFRAFLQSSLCAQATPVKACDAARSRLGVTGAAEAPRP